jgi:hypothetical protein
MTIAPSNVTSTSGQNLLFALAVNIYIFKQLCFCRGTGANPSKSFHVHAIGDDISLNGA